MSTTCIFCAITARRAPAYIVHEDAICVAFLDRRPVRPGALMVVPKQHIDAFCDLPDAVACHIMTVAQRIARAMRERLQPIRVGMALSGFGVSHAHLHVIPLYDPHDVTSRAYARVKDGAVVFDLEAAPVAAPEDQESVRRLLAEALA